MKNIGKISVLVVGFVFLILTVMPVKAAVTVSQDGQAISYFNCVAGTSCNATWAKLKTSDGNVVYCLDLGNEWPSASGDEYSDEAIAMDAGLIYILENGYPNKSIVDSSLADHEDRDRYITQGAVWLYMTGGNNFENTTDPDGVLPPMLQLVREARAARDSGDVGTALIKNINVSSNSMYLNNDGSYYVSSEITPEIIHASEYRVTVSGAEVLTSSGSVSSDGRFNVGDSFLIRVPASAGNNSNFKVKISIDSESFAISPIVTTDGLQRVAGLSRQKKVSTKEITLTTKTPKVCVNYVIVGDVRPDPSLTDPTPLDECFDKGYPYPQKPELTTRTDCTFNGWYTKDILTGKWVDGTALNEDLTLYGAWNCPTVVDVPPTAAQTPLIILGMGLLSVGVGYIYYYFKVKKQA